MSVTYFQENAEGKFVETAKEDLDESRFYQTRFPKSPDMAEVKKFVGQLHTATEKLLGK